MDTHARQPGNPNFEQRVRDSFPRQGAMALLGARLARVAPGECEIHLPYRDDLGQQHGFFHGGVLATIADSAAGCAGFTLMPANVAVLTIEFETNFLAPARGVPQVACGAYPFPACRLPPTMTRNTPRGGPPARIHGPVP